MIRPARHLLGFNTQVITLWCFYISGAHTRTDSRRSAHCGILHSSAQSVVCTLQLQSNPLDTRTHAPTVALSSVSAAHCRNRVHMPHMYTHPTRRTHLSMCNHLCRPQGSFTAPSQLLHSSWCSLIPLMQRPDIQLDLVVRLVASGPPVHLLQRLGHQLRHLDIGDQRHAVVHGEAANRVIQQEAL